MHQLPILVLLLYDTIRMLTLWTYFGVCLFYVARSSTTLMAWQIAKKSQSFGYCCYITSNWPDFLCTNRHQLFSPRYNFFCKIDNIHFFCLVQKSVTVCFQSILLVSKRLLIILLSHSKFFIGHCTYPLFLGTFSFAASSRIYHFFCQMDFKRLPTSYDLLSLTIFYISCYCYINTVLKKRMSGIQLSV